MENVRKIYLHDPRDVEVLSGTVSLLRACRERKIPVIQVTNQVGIGCGICGWQEFVAVEAHNANLFAA